MGGMCYKRESEIARNGSEVIHGAGIDGGWQPICHVGTGERKRAGCFVLPSLFRAARTAEMQNDLQFLRVLYVLFGLLLSCGSCAIPARRYF